jgi:hypothetical protein
MWVRRRANISRHETVHTVLGIRFDFSAPSRTLRAENGLSLLARLRRSAVDPCWQAHTHFLIAESEFLYAIWNPASQYEIVDSRLSRHWVWAQETDGVVVLSHPIIAIEGVLDDLWWADIDLWDESMEAKLEKYRSALWTLLNEFGVLCRASGRFLAARKPMNGCRACATVWLWRTLPSGETASASGR